MFQGASVRIESNPELSPRHVQSALAQVAATSTIAATRTVAAGESRRMFGARLGRACDAPAPAAGRSGKDWREF